MNWLQNSPKGIKITKPSHIAKPPLITSGRPTDKGINIRIELMSIAAISFLLTGNGIFGLCDIKLKCSACDFKLSSSP